MLIKYPKIHNEEKRFGLVYNKNINIHKIILAITKIYNKYIKQSNILQSRLIQKIKYYMDNEIIVGIAYILIAPLIFKILMIIYTFIIGANVMLYISVLTIAILVYIKGVSILLFNDKLNVFNSKGGKTAK